eukprot:12401-Heterococcus_DN1.PRE.1
MQCTAAAAAYTSMACEAATCFCFVVAGHLMLHSASLHSIHILVTHPSSIDVHVVQLAKHPAAAAVLVVPGCSLSIAH